MKKKHTPKVADTLVKIEDCYVAPENARANLLPESIDELAANVAEYGLLQPMVGYVDADGRFAVCDGRRRLAALTRTLAPGVTVAVRQIDQADAVAVALASNTERVALGIVEEVEAFARMARDGKDVAAIARAFGITERHVRGRIALASLHEPILDALRAGEISLDVAQAYAGAHMARQEKVWKALGKHDRKRTYYLTDVKRALNENTLRAGDALAKFVGDEGYRAAGGQVEEDFFVAPDMARWLNPEIAERLAQEKLQEIGAKEGEGFAFVETGIEIADWQFPDGNLGKKRKPTAEEKERLATIKQRRKALQKSQDALYASDDEELDNDQYDAAEKLLNDENDALNAEERRIEAGLLIIPDEARAKSGITVTIDADGAPLIRRGVLKPKERKATPAGKAKASGKAASAKPSKPEPQAPMTNLTHETLSRVASTIVGRELAAQPTIALIAVTAAAARDIFFQHSYESSEALALRGFDGGANFEGLATDKARATDFDTWKLAIGKKDAIETTLASWKHEDVLDLFAFCVGQSVRVIETNAARVYSKQEGRGVLMTLGALLGIDPAKHYTPTADFINGFSRATLEDAAAELGLDSAGAKTKSALAAMVADKAKEARWTPPLLRLLCGADVKKPAAKAKAPAKKTAAKKASPKKAAKKIAQQPPKPVKAKKAKANGAAEARP